MKILILAEHDNQDINPLTLNSVTAALPNRQQQAFIFRYLEAYSTNQTALAMNCSEGSVKTHLSRANQKLKFLLKDIYYD